VLLACCFEVMLDVEGRHAFILIFDGSHCRLPQQWLAAAEQKFPQMCTAPLPFAPFMTEPELCLMPYSLIAILRP
jgi:hypothetical protein